MRPSLSATSKATITTRPVEASANFSEVRPAHTRHLEPQKADTNRMVSGGWGSTINITLKPDSVFVAQRAYGLPPADQSEVQTRSHLRLPSSLHQLLDRHRTVPVTSHDQYSRNFMPFRPTNEPAIC